MQTIHELLKSLNACEDARKWAKQYTTIEEIVTNCHRGDWLLWLAKKVGVPLKPLTMAKVRCAKTVIHLMKDQRSITALEVAEKFALTDEITLDDLRNAAYAAADAAYAAYAAADAAAYAAYAAYAANAAANAAADAAAYAANAAAYAANAAYAARIKNQKQTSDICRETIGKLLIDLVNSKL